MPVRTATPTTSSTATLELPQGTLRQAADGCLVHVVGRRSSPRVQEYRDFLTRNSVVYRWVDVERDPLVGLLGGAAGLKGSTLPLLLFRDGSVLEPTATDPSGSFAHVRSRLAERVGLHARPRKSSYDLVIVGAGPAGLTAAVYAASEGLDTLVIERHAPGGQAGTSARIENFPGFPAGISGRELAEAAYEQALRFGAEIVVGSDVVSARTEEDGALALGLVNGAQIRARAGIGASGAQYRRLDAPGVEALRGIGVYYGAAPHEAAFHRGGNVFVVGGANSAGQAALQLASQAASVTIVVRGSSLGARMSQYLVDRLEAHPRITVRPRSRIVRALGDGKLERLVIADDTQGEEIETSADALFILIGGSPVSERVAGWLRHDEHGFLLTGHDVLEDGGGGPSWPLDRDPYPLEASQPGVFIAGDARHGSVKRIASAVGEGAMAVQNVHRYLAGIDRRRRAHGI